MPHCTSSSVLSCPGLGSLRDQSHCRDVWKTNVSFRLFSGPEANCTARLKCLPTCPMSCEIPPEIATCSRQAPQVNQSSCASGARELHSIRSDGIAPPFAESFCVTVGGFDGHFSDGTLTTR